MEVRWGRARGETTENKWKDRMRSREKLKYRIHADPKKSLHNLPKIKAPTSQ